MLEDIQDFISAVNDFIRGLDDKIKGAIGSALSPIKASVDVLQSIVAGQLKGVLDFAKGIADNVDNSLRAAASFASLQASTLASSLEDRVLAVVEPLTASIAAVASDIETRVTSSLDSVVDAVEGTITTATATLTEPIESLTGTVNTLADDLGEKVTSGISGVVSSVTETVVPLLEQTAHFFVEGISTIGGALQAIAEGVQTGATGLGIALGEKVADLIGFSVKDDLGALRTVVDSITELMAQDPEIAKIMDSLGGLSTFGISMVMLISSPLFISNIVSSAVIQRFAGGFEEVRVRSLAEYQPTRLNAGEVQHLMRRMPDQIRILFDELKDLGYTPERSAFLRLLSQELLPVTEVVQLWLRGELDDVDLEERLTALGFWKSDRAGIKKLAFYIPPAQDLIRMAVREVFTPEIAEAFGQFEGLPTEFVTWGRKQGISEEWARNYWAAHWELPSAQMGFEMLHRKVITENELHQLLRALDVMPFWRSKITQISYRPLTRVDVRRMHKIGVLTRAQVKDAYEQLGYNDHNAELMTEFTVQYNAGPSEDDAKETRDLTRAQILTMYDERAIDRDRASGLLREIDYDEFSAETFLSLRDLDRVRRQRDASIQLIKSRFLNGLLSYNDAVTALDTIEVDPSERELMLTVLEGERNARVRLPTKGQLDALLKRGLITEEEYRQPLLAQGYPDFYITRWHQAVLLGALEQQEEG